MSLLALFVGACIWAAGYVGFLAGVVPGWVSLAADGVALLFLGGAWLLVEEGY